MNTSYLKRFVTRTAAAATAVTLAVCPLSNVDAAVPGSSESWNSGGVSGWQLVDVLNGVDVSSALSNTGGELTASFRALTSVSKPQAYVMLADATASGGAFAGDYTGASAVRFRIRCNDMAPSAVRVYVHSASGNQWWYHPVSGLAVGEWVTVDVPLSYSAGWFQGVGDTESGFNAALADVTWVGVYVRRNSSLSAQTYSVDDFTLEGAPPTATIAGVVSYGGPQSGATKVLASTTAGAWSSSQAAIAGSGGGYAIADVPTLVGYWVKAYRDSNANGTRDFWEASGEANDGQSIGRLVGDRSDVDVVLVDPGTSDGLPYWWLVDNFEITSSESASGYAALDADGDGLSNFGEYRAGTDPNNELDVFKTEMEESAQGIVVSWKYSSGNTYSVWRSQDLPSGFTLLKSGIAAGSYVDGSASGAGPYYYRVEVE